jgi:hypothetical protein
MATRVTRSLAPQVVIDAAVLFQQLPADLAKRREM